mgnify:CR=1 FL=1
MDFLAETVGFEPTCPCGQPDFESSSLRPLRYVSMFLQHLFYTIFWLLLQGDITMRYNSLNSYLKETHTTFIVYHAVCRKASPSWEFCENYWIHAKIKLVDCEKCFFSVVWLTAFQKSTKIIVKFDYDSFPSGGFLWKHP